MAKITLDRSGELRKEVFYRFGVPLDDQTDGEEFTNDWIIVPREPTGDALALRGENPWTRIAESGDPDTEVRIRDCPTGATHVTHSYYTKVAGVVRGGPRVSPIVPTTNFCTFALSEGLRRRLDVLKVRGARIDPIDFD